MANHTIAHSAEIARARLLRAVARSVAHDFALYGIDVVAKLRKEKPAAYLQLVILALGPDAVAPTIAEAAPADAGATPPAPCAATARDTPCGAHESGLLRRLAALFARRTRRAAEPCVASVETPTL